MRISRRAAELVAAVMRERRRSPGSAAASRAGKQHSACPVRGRLAGRSRE